MTVSYSCGFTRLLLKWRGSVWKLIWKPLVLWLAAYYALNLSYRFAMNPTQQQRFERAVSYCDGMTGSIPLSMLLGFFVKEVLQRWYRQFSAIIYPDTVGLKLLGFLEDQPDNLDNLRMYRRSMMRWLFVVCVLCWRQLSIRIRRRFPTLQHLVAAGLLTEEELRLLNEANTAPEHDIWHVPFAWIINLARELELNKTFGDKGYVATREIMRECENLHFSSCQQLLDYDWLSVPVVYAQVATVATYGFFLIALIGRQEFVNRDPANPHQHTNVYFPFLTVLQFVFYMGWLAVGEDLCRPLGQDDDDFEFNYLLDRHVHVGLQWADQLATQHPTLIRDDYWGQARPLLPYTQQALRLPDHARPQMNIPAKQLNKLREDDEIISDRRQIEQLKQYYTNTNTISRIVDRWRCKSATTAKVGDGSTGGATTTTTTGDLADVVSSGYVTHVRLDSTAADNGNAAPQRNQFGTDIPGALVEASDNELATGGRSGRKSSNRL